MPTIDFVYFNAGGGHRATALALQAVIGQQHRPWQVRLIDLARVLDPSCCRVASAGRMRRCCAH